MATAGDCMDRSAALMNNVSKSIYSYTIQLPYFKMAWDWLKNKLEDINSQVLREYSATVTYTANATSITKPADLLLPLALFERTAGSTNEDDWLPMSFSEWEPLQNAQTTIGFWTYRENEIQVRKCNANRDVKIRYIKDGGSITNENTTISVNRVVNLLAMKTAYYLSVYVAKNDTRAAALVNDLNDEWSSVTSLEIKGQQAIAARRRPYRLRGRRFYTNS